MTTKPTELNWKQVCTGLFEHWLMYDVANHEVVYAPLWFRLGGWFSHETYWRIDSWMARWDRRFRMRYVDRWLKKSKLHQQYVNGRMAAPLGYLWHG